jgi:DNA-directed RNA polymerase sigma subunit (sigma70/sigma32)
MTAITDRQRIALRLRLGFGGCRVHSLDEIAEILETTRDKVRKLCNDAMIHLRQGDIKPTDFPSG